MKRWKVTTIAIAALLLALLVWWAVHPTGQIGASLLTGWIAFLVGVLPQVEIDGQGVAVCIAATLMLIGILHLLLRWLHRETRGEAAAPRVWRLRWTAAIVGLLLLSFVAGTTMIGVVHQIGWLATSHEPMFQHRVDHPTAQHNFRYLWIAIEGHEDGEGSLPSRRRNDPRASSADDQPAPQSWVTGILPYVSISTSELDRRQEWNAPVNKPFFQGIVPMLINPELPADRIRNGEGYGLNHYAGNPHLLDADQRLHLNDIIDGAGQTILVGEVNSDFVPWGQPGNCRDPEIGINKPGGFGGAPGNGGAVFLMADGSTQFISVSTSPRVLRALATPAGAERVQAGPPRP
jgi:hypothetical protein